MKDSLYVSGASSSSPVQSMSMLGTAPENTFLFMVALLTVALISLASTGWHRPVHFSPSYPAENRHMGGLLHHESSNDAACLSRTEHHLLGRRIDYRPSSYLVSRLRRYESIHQRCAPEAESFHQVLITSNTSSSRSRSSESGCKFVVWISFEGLGNKLLSLVSAFIYALLTDRVLLVDRGTDMEKLLCEPFQGSSWFVPLGFPNDWMHSLDSSPIRLGRLVDRGTSCGASLNTTDLELPSIAYMQMDWFSTPFDKMFFCEHEQQLLQRQVKWLMIKANAYYVPSLYSVPSFRHELENLFPEPASTFHYAARYLLHPTNNVWLKATRFFKEYLAGADSLLGLQLRPFNSAETKRYSDQLLQCLMREKLLPNVTMDETRTLMNSSSSKDRRVTSVLVTSLHQIFTEELQSRYIKNPTVVKVHSPSHDGFQQTNNLEHDEKALMEIFLLAMSDSLVTSPRSTFGYVAYGLAGIKPWTLHGNSMMQDPICSRMLSSDPCFLSNPDAAKCSCQADASGVSPCLDDPRGGVQLLPVSA